MPDRQAGGGSGRRPARRAAPPGRIRHPVAAPRPNRREQSAKYPFPKWLFAALAAIVAVNAACWLQFPLALRDFASLTRAERYNNGKHFLLAAREYSSLADIYAGSDGIIEKKLDAMMACGDLPGAAGILYGYFAGKNVSNTLKGKIDGYSAVLDKYGRADRKIRKALEGAAGKRAALESLEALLDSSDTDPCVLVQTALLNESLGNRAEALRQMNEAVSKGDRYLCADALLAGMLRRSGNAAGAGAACAQALEKNSDDVEAHRQMAILRMLVNDWKAGETCAETAYALDCGGQYVRETLAVACHMAGDYSRRDAVIAEMRQAGDDMAGVESIIAGTTTPEAIYRK